MVREAEIVDVASMPDLARLAREVARDGRRRVLRDAETNIAILSPARPRKRRTSTLTAAQQAAVLSAFGGWNGQIDAAQMKRDLKEARSDHRSPGNR